MDPHGANLSLEALGACGSGIHFGAGPAAEFHTHVKNIFYTHVLYDAS